MQHDETQYTEENSLNAKSYLFMQLIEKNALQPELLTSSEIDEGFALSHDKDMKDMLERLSKNKGE